jgi:hypothetical protein
LQNFPDTTFVGRTGRVDTLTRADIDPEITAYRQNHPVAAGQAT